MSHQKQYEYEQRVKNWLDGNDEGYSGTGIKPFIRRYLLEKYDYKCQRCGWGELNPYTHNVTLEVHHKDGNYKNNKEGNLELLCPNCHSLTDTYKSLNCDSVRDNRNKYVNRKIVPRNYCIDCGVVIDVNSTRCIKCSNIKKNSKPIPVQREDLKQLIRTVPFVQIGSRYGVTDGAIRKWCKRYNLPYKSSKIKAITDDQWEAI